MPHNNNSKKQYRTRHAEGAAAAPAEWDHECLLVVVVMMVMVVVVGHCLFVVMNTRTVGADLALSQPRSIAPHLRQSGRDESEAAEQHE